jgi:catechol 2,3-dioxygenase-like lactoylglutathione lyase family enzyme
MQLFALLLAMPLLARAQSDSGQLPTPHFHHLHLNATDPDAAIAFYTKQFPSAVKDTFAGYPALKIHNVYVLFTKVSATPTTTPQSAIWHFGWQVVDVRKNLAHYMATGVPLLPLYTSDEGGEVFINSDSWPGTGGILGLTKAQIADAKAKGIKPVGGPGFAYLQGPDGALIEYAGTVPVEHFNHVHMYQEDPYCARIWYQKHLNAPVDPTPAGQPVYTEANCKVPRGEPTWPALVKEGTIRKDRATVTYDDVALTWYVRPGEQPLVGSRGQLYDHIALSVSDLNAWMAKLKKEKVKFLGKPYKLGDTRAVMIEGPSKEAIELVEVK